MHRVTWIVLAFLALAGTARAQAPADSVERARALHAINRLTFGARPGDVDRVTAMGVDAFIAEQLQPESITDAALERRLRTFTVLRTDQAELAGLLRAARRERRERQMADTAGASMLERARRGDQGSNVRALRRLVAEFQQAPVVRAVLSERQLYEVMVDFWTNHFNVFLAKGPIRALLPAYIEQTIRPHALGRFDELLTATARSPAMLVYLDNAQSVAPGAVPPQLERMRSRRAQARAGRRPQAGSARERADSMLRRLEERMPRGLNENYARELLELHTLGVDGGYTQDDVVGVARILTGWSVRGIDRAPEFAFHEWAHDTGSKTVLGIDFAAGRGMDEGVELLQLLAAHPSTRRHVSRKLCTRFVNDRPPAGCVDAAVDAWERTGGDVREVVAAILRSPEFWASEQRDAKLKTPFEFVASAVRAVGGEPDTTPILAQVIGRLGQPLFLQPAPTGYPETQEAWVNSGALLQRANVALALAAGRLPGVRVTLGRILPPSSTVQELVAAVNQELLGGRASHGTIRVLTAEAERTIRHADARMLVVGLALGSPEFQRQ